MAPEQIIAIFTIMTDIQRNHKLKAHNTFGLDSMAAGYAKPVNTEALIRLLEEKEKLRQKHLVMGEGSNILFKSDFGGLIIQPGMKGIEVVEETGEDVVVKVGASENWDNWVRHACEQGWYGLENLSLIPGSVGSSPVQNIGAYGVELKDMFEWLEAWDLELNQRVQLDHDSCCFSYRNSIFKAESRGRYIITHVTFRLSRKPVLHLDYGNVKKEFSKANGSTPMDLRNVIISIRESKLPDPARYGNVGSFFKNPLVDRTIFNCMRVDYPDLPFYPGEDNQVKIPAAWFIEKSGWKGKRIGNVGTWPSQALVIVNYGGASGQEIFDFSEQILKDVEEKFAVSLQREVNVV